MSVDLHTFALYVYVKQLHIPFPDRLMLRDVVSEECNDCSVHSFHLVVDVGMTGSFPKHAVTAAKNFDTSGSPLVVSSYIGIPYRITQLSINTLAALVDVTALTDISLSASCICLSR